MANYNSLLGQAGGGLGQFDPYQEMQRQLMMQGRRPISREEYEKSISYVNEEPKKKADPKQDETLLLLTEEE